MKNAIEGLFLGGIMETVFRGYRYVKVRRDKNLGKKVDEKQLKDDEKFLEKQDIEKIREADEAVIPSKIILQNLSTFHASPRSSPSKRLL